MPPGAPTRPTPEIAAVDRLSSEWLSLYLTDYRERLSPAELAELADALERSSTSESGLMTLATDRRATAGRWLIEFLANIKSSRLRQALVRDAIKHLRAAAR
jgi:hypothetical protein